MCRMFVYSGVQEWLFHHQEESEQSRNYMRYMHVSRVVPRLLALFLYMALQI